MTTVGPHYYARAVSAILGPAHASGIPDALWGAWLDSGLEVLAYTGARVPHEAFAETAGGVANISLIDGGHLPADAALFALMDAETDGRIVLMTTFTTTATTGEAVAFPPGSLRFTYDGPLS